MASVRAVGLAASVGASVIWGLSPLFYALLEGVPAVDIIAHRTVWSVVLFAAILTAGGMLPALGALIREPRALGLLALAAVLISINWLVFVMAVQGGYVVEASLGYYVFPLVVVALGRLVFGERPETAQWLAVSLAALGVAILGLGLGAAPWFSLILAGSFAAYSAVKRCLKADATVTVTVEVTLLAPLALVWIVARGGAGFGDAWVPSLLLIATGPMTALPLVLFSVAAQRLHFATLGIFFYLAPTLQFLLGLLVFAEPFTLWHGIAFPLIWGAVTLYSLSLWRASRRTRNAAMAASASETA